jgi:hypothetical protein
LPRCCRVGDIVLNLVNQVGSGVEAGSGPRTCGVRPLPPRGDMAQFFKVLAQNNRSPNHEQRRANLTVSCSSILSSNLSVLASISL